MKERKEEREYSGQLGYHRLGGAFQSLLVWALMASTAGIQPTAAQKGCMQSASGLHYQPCSQGALSLYLEQRGNIITSSNTASAHARLADSLPRNTASAAAFLPFHVSANTVSLAAFSLSA